MSEQTLPPYRLKIEGDQKCYKVSVDVHHNNPTVARLEAVELLKDTVAQLKENGFTVAPLETSK